MKQLSSFQLFWVVLFLYNLGFTQTLDTIKKWSLQDCNTYAIEHNLDIKQQLLSLEESKLDIKTAKGAFLPNLNAGVGNNWNFGLTENPLTGQIVDQQIRSSSYGISSNIPIYNGMKNYNTLQQAKLQQIASQLNIDKTKDDIRINITNAFLQVLLQKENIDILKSQHQSTLEQLKQSNEMVKSGNLPRGEVLQLEAVEANDLQNIAEAENSFNISKLGLKRLLNIDLSKKIVLEEQDISLAQIQMLKLPINTIVEQVLEKRNEIKLFKTNIELAKKNVEISKGNFLPNLSGTINLNTREQNKDILNRDYVEQLRINTGLSVGLNLTIPIFNRYTNKNIVAKSKINVKKSKNRLVQVEQRLIQDVYQVYFNAKASYKTYQASVKTSEAQKLAYEYQQTRFKVGQTNLLDYTQNKIRYQNSQTQLIQAKYDLLFRLKLLGLYFN